jgi:hypothetical protein
MATTDVVAQRVYGKKTDVFSFGVTVWEIVVRDDPYSGMDPLTVSACARAHV